MNKEIIKKLIILAQEREVKLAPREMEIKFAGKINSIIGPRRAGKTFFIYQNMNELRNNDLRFLLRALS